MNKTTLKNGLTIITYANPNSQSVVFGYSANVGSYGEELYPSGTAHFVEHMLFKGTTTRNYKQINREIARYAGWLNAYTSFEETKYLCKIPSQYWEKGLDILSDIYWNSTLPFEEIDKERNVIQEEIISYNDSPSDFAIESIFTHAYPEHKERQSIAGTLESVNKITKEHLLSFVNNYYSSHNTVLVVTGNIKHEDVINFMNNYHITRTSYTVINKKEFTPIKLQGKTYKYTKDIEQGHLAWCLFSPSLYEDDSTVIEIILNILCSHMGTRLYEIIREEKGLCYDISLEPQLTRDHGIIIGHVSLKQKNIAKVKKIIIEEFQRLQNELVDIQEFEDIISYTIGSTLLDFEDNLEINDCISSCFLSGLDYDIEEYIANIKKVTREDIQRVAKKYFDKNNFMFVKITTR
jgi:predicted Zn-dependent peptidase